MKTESIELLVEPADIHDFVMGLWSDGPIRFWPGSTAWQDLHATKAVSPLAASPV